MPQTAPTLAQDQKHEDRIAEILGKVRGTFAEKGFDGASMQDLARAAGMSPGNFYRYFPSKTAIVEGLIAADLNQIEQDFGRLMQAPVPLEALRHMLRAHIREKQDCADGQIWAEITAASQRKPDICSTCQGMEDTIRGFLTRVFARATGLSETEAAHRFGAHAAYLILLFKSATMLSSQPPALREDLLALILRTMDQTLDFIADTRPKG